MRTMNANIKNTLDQGAVIPASPLALNERRELDERRQRALWRYYLDAGAGGIAVGVHTTQFEIRDPNVGLFEPILELAQEEFDSADTERNTPIVRIAGACGKTPQAQHEATMAAKYGFHAVLLSLSAMRNADVDELIAHCRQISQVLPVIGFYLQPDVGGRVLPYEFWRKFAEIENVVAIKMAPFNRYRTLDVVRAVVEAKRNDIALYTGNDDNIVMDLLTPFRFKVNGQVMERRIVGGLLGHWSVWTRRAVELLERCHMIVEKKESIPNDMLRLANEVTDCNAAFFDAANNFSGVIAGIHEVLRRQGLLEGTWCLNPQETLSPGQSAEIDRVYASYPHLNDDDFVRQNLSRWLG